MENNHKGASLLLPSIKRPRRIKHNFKDEIFNGRGYMFCKILQGWHSGGGKKYLNLEDTPIAKNTLSGTTLTKNSLQSIMERIGSQTK
jgi:hypothetical protein